MTQPATPSNAGSHRARQTRCHWCGNDPLYVHYHDSEWGVPQHDDDALFEKMVLEGFQAGLSWITVLRKRARFRAVFHNFHIPRVAAMTPDDVERLLRDPGIIRSRGKIQAAINNAGIARELQREFGSLDAYFWEFVDGTPVRNEFRHIEELPAKTELSERLAKDLKKRGVKYLGPTSCYAFMQAMGLVNDHLVTCFRYPEVNALSESPPRDRA
jgi:DNA-3-methyladenine glycosylase I